MKVTNVIVREVVGAGFFFFILNQHITDIKATVITDNNIMTVTGSTTVIITFVIKQK